MSRVVVLCGAAVLLLGCAQSGDQAGGGDDQAAPAAISLADVAGTWSMQTAAMGSDSILTTSTLVATNSMDGWYMVLASGDTVPVRVVVVDADSIVSEAGPFASVLRQGQMVSTHMVARMRDGKMITRITAIYHGGVPDSVEMLRMAGVRAPEPNPDPDGSRNYRLSPDTVYAHIVRLLPRLSISIVSMEPGRIVAHETYAGENVGAPWNKQPSQERVEYEIVLRRAWQDPGTADLLVYASLSWRPSERWDWSPRNSSRKGDRVSALLAAFDAEFKK